MNQKTANKKYNPNSAITHLQRMGKSIQGAACIDNVSFTYSGNQLSAAQDTGIPASLMGDAFHFVDGDDYYSEYGYDGCGSLTSDSNKGVYKILYDFNGMPTCVWFDNGSITDYVYTADGVKLKTVHRTAVPGTVPSGSTPSLSEQNTLSKDSTLYVGALEVESSIREKYYYANGYLDIVYGNLDSYNYYATDHLGNVRHVARATPSGVGSIIQANNYYPFGGLLNEGDNQLYVQRKLYNGKEYDRMQGLNLYDYGARQYDPAICRFTSMDPLCEKYYHISPYAYCGGNPVNRIDENGDSISLAILRAQDNAKGLYRTNSIITDLQDITGLSLFVDKKGFLQYGESSDRGSESARQFLTSLIDSKQTISVMESNHRTGADGNNIAISDRQIEDIISSTPIDLDNRTLGYGMTFLHELTHTIAGGGLKDPQLTVTNETGQTVDFVNKIRAELDSKSLSNQHGMFGTRMRYYPIQKNGQYLLWFQYKIQNKKHSTYIPIH